MNFDLSAREQATARNFARAQAAWDNMTPPEYETEAIEDAALDAAADEIMCNGGVIADALSSAMSTSRLANDYESVPVARLCKPEFAADDKSLAVLLAVMASGDAESARRALMAWRLKLPELLKESIESRAAEMLAGAQ